MQPVGHMLEVRSTISPSAPESQPTAPLIQRAPLALRLSRPVAVVATPARCTAHDHGLNRRQHSHASPWTAAGAFRCRR